MVQQTVSYVREQEKKHNKIIKLSLTTNGMYLDEEKVKYLTDNHIALILSLDGRKENHDRMRPGVHGEGTYDRVLKNLQYCVAHRDGRDGEEYYVRGTYTKYNLDFTNDVLDMVDKGFPAVSMEPVVGDLTEPYAIQEEDLPRVKEEYETLAKVFIQREEEGHPFFYFHFNMNLWQGPCLPKRLRGCGAPRLRRGPRIPCGRAERRHLSVPSVRRPRRLCHRQCIRRPHQYEDDEGIPGKSRAEQTGMRGLLGEIFLLRRLSRQ